MFSSILKKQDSGRTSFGYFQVKFLNGFQEEEQQQE